MQASIGEGVPSGDIESCVFGDWVVAGLPGAVYPIYDGCGVAGASWKACEGVMVWAGMDSEKAHGVIFSGDEELRNMHSSSRNEGRDKHGFEVAPLR